MERAFYQQIEDAAGYLKSIAEPPTVAVILGSGLGAFASTLEDTTIIPYGDIPHFPDVHVVGHSGQLVIGNLPNTQTRVAALAGRVHLYEGHAVSKVVHPVRSLAKWGVQATILTNAAGGINPSFNVGDLMLITDHLNLSGTNPLLGLNDARLGTRFPDMSAAYNPAFGEKISAWAQTSGIKLQRGVYCGLLGPSYETPAEIKMLRTMGGDAVGMSTVCEVIAANHAGMAVAGFSCITNLAAGMGDEPLNHQEVKASADEARDRFIRLLKRSVIEFDQIIS